MPDSDRSLLLPAIFGIAAFAFVAGITLGGDWTSRPYQETEKPYASAEEYIAAAATNSFAAYPMEESNRCYSAKSHDSADLCAQWRAAIAAEKAANAAVWSNRLSIIGTVLSGVGLAFLLVTVRQGRRGLARAGEANEISRREFEISHKPILVFEPLAPLIKKGSLKNLHIDPPRIYDFMVGVKVTNTGNGDAELISFSLEGGDVSRLDRVAMDLRRRIGKGEVDYLASNHLVRAYEARIDREDPYQRRVIQHAYARLPLAHPLPPQGPPFIVKVRYRDILGIVREQSAGFIPSHVDGDWFATWGDEEVNYDKKVDK